MPMTASDTDSRVTAQKSSVGKPQYGFFLTVQVKLKSQPITEPERLPFLRQPALAKLKGMDFASSNHLLENLPGEILNHIFEHLQDDPKILAAIAATSRRLLIAVSQPILFNARIYYFPFLQKILEASIIHQFEKILAEYQMGFDQLFNNILPQDPINIGKREMVQYLSRLTEDEVRKGIVYLLNVEANKAIAFKASPKSTKKFSRACYSLIVLLVLGEIAAAIYGFVLLQGRLGSYTIPAGIAVFLICPLLIGIAGFIGAHKLVKRFSEFDEARHLRNLNSRLTNPLPDLRQKVCENVLTPDELSIYAENDSDSDESSMNLTF